MTHLWVRAEQRANEQRVGIMPDGVAALQAHGIHVTVEKSDQRIVPYDAYAAVGAEIMPEGSWINAPKDAIIFGLKELPEGTFPLNHRHIMFGHAYKGQPTAQTLLNRFRTGGGMLYDLEALAEDTGRRVAAFGYWAGYVGAAVSLTAWIAQSQGEICGPVSVYDSSTRLLSNLQAAFIEKGAARPTVLIIGAKGRVGQGAADLCTTMGVAFTCWDQAETAHGGPFPEILVHDIYLNCIFARPETPVFVSPEMLPLPRNLSVIGDIACDPGSTYNPIPIYDHPTTWANPVLRRYENPILDVMAIDNLPSLLPMEASEDFAAQLLPSLLRLNTLNEGVWARAETVFHTHIKA